MASRTSNGGQNRLLDQAQSQAIFNYIELQYHAGFSATRAMIQGAVGHLLSIATPPKPMPSDSWVYKWIKSNLRTTIKKVKTKPLDTKRQTAQDQAVL